MSDLDIAMDDLALDALADGFAPDGDDEALALLYALRTDLDSLDTPDAPDTVVVPLRPRRRRPGALIALAAAAGIVVGGITAGAVVVADKPGELLYAAHSAILGTENHTADRVTLLLDQASGALARGDRTAARTLLARATALLPSVPDAGDRAALRARLATLSGYAAEPVPSRSAEPGDDHGGSSGSGSDDSVSGTSGSGSSGSGSDDSSSGTSGGSDDSGTSGGSGTSDTSGTSGSGTSGSGTSGGSDDSLSGSGSGSGSDDSGSSGGSGSTSGSSGGSGSTSGSSGSDDSGSHGGSGSG